jgi:hypothetical protein
MKISFKHLIKLIGLIFVYGFGLIITIIILFIITVVMIVISTLSLYIFNSSFREIIKL